MSTTAEPEPPARMVQRQPWPFRHCPACGHEEFEVSCQAGHVVFGCQSCDRSWRFVLGYLQELPAARRGIGSGVGDLGEGANGLNGLRTATMPTTGPAAVRITGQG